MFAPLPRAARAPGKLVAEVSEPGKLLLSFYALLLPVLQQPWRRRRIASVRHQKR
jgi:hypothetical protein